MAQKIIILGFMIFAVFMVALRYEEPIASNEGIEEAVFIEHFRSASAEIRIEEDTDSLTTYQVLQRDSTKGFDFGWFHFRVKRYYSEADAISAYLAYNNKMLGWDKAPEYRFRYKKRMYILDTACCYEEYLESVYLKFLEGIDQTLLDPAEITHVECGGRRIPV